MPLFPFKLYKVSGHSMQPTLKAGQFVLGQINSNIEKGDIAVIEHQGQMLLKRITEINFSDVYLVGDNPNDSLDSRDFGWIPRNKVVAKTIWY